MLHSAHALTTISTRLFIILSWTTRVLTTIDSHACWTMKGYILDKYLHGRYEDGIWSCTLFLTCPLARPAKSVPSNLSISPPPSLTWPSQDEFGLTFALIATTIYCYPIRGKSTRKRLELGDPKRTLILHVKSTNTFLAQSSSIDNVCQSVHCAVKFF